jgi:hypothetical protein
LSSPSGIGEDYDRLPAYQDAATASKPIYENKIYPHSGRSHENPYQSSNHNSSKLSRSYELRQAIEARNIQSHFQRYSSYHQSFAPASSRSSANPSIQTAREWSAANEALHPTRYAEKLE